MELTILIPCLNEAETVGSCIIAALRFIEEASIEAEILVADNGSTDGSQEIAARSGARVIEIAEKGYGSALMGGIQAAQGELIIMGDADGSYDLYALKNYLNMLRLGNDLVMGNRFQGGIAPGAMPFLHRYLGNPVLSAIGRLFFRSKIGDFHCGLRGFRKESILALDLRTKGMEFASEMVVKATLFNFKVAEVPTTLSPAGRSRPPHLRTWRDGWRHLRFLLLYSPRWLFLYPGILLTLLGVLISALLLIAPITIGRATFDIHTLLYSSMAIVLGYQAILFAVFSKIFTISEGLLPEDVRLNRIFQAVRLEAGLVVGGLLILVGTILSIAAYSSWSSRSFGDLEPRETFRIVIPSVVALLLGVQTVLYSFFLSVLSLRR